MSYRRQWLFLSLGALLVSAAHAQVTMDGTLGPATSLPGPDYAITPDLGQQLGGNLFYSFGQFSIYAGESATFSGPGSITNIIGRITGGNVSFIDGAIRSTIPGANLYLLNPAGVLFGEHASLDVPGSVHISTADYLRLSDGGRFDARTPGESVLTVAPVEAFGFLSATPAPILVNGSFLQVPEGQTLSLIGGDITLTNATLYAPAGRINVAAVGSPGEVLPTEDDLVLQGFDRLGMLTTERDPDAGRVTVNLGQPFGEVPLGDLDASGERGGAIFIRGGQWFSRGAMVGVTNYGAQPGRDIDVEIAGSIRFMDGAGLGIGTWAGAGGNLTLTVGDTLTLLNGSLIGTSAFGQGHAGAVLVNARNVLIDSQGAPPVTTALGSYTTPRSTGQGGDLTLNVADTLIVQNGGFIGSFTLGGGNAGDVTISAHNLLVDGMEYGSELNDFTGISSSAYPGSSGNAGNINITVADTLTIRNGAQILAGTFGQGDAGNMTIHAGRAVIITGHVVASDGSIFRSGLFVESDRTSTGQAGALTVTTPSLTLDDGGGIIAVSFNTSGGNIIINADHLKMFNGSVISSRTFGAAPGSNGGNVTINSTNFVALNGSLVTAQTVEGLGGNIVLNAEVFLHDAARVDEVLNASSEVFGNDGTVQNNAPTTDISGSLVALNTPYLDAAGQLSPRCGTGDPKDRSRFVVQGRGSLPPDPGDALTIQAGRCSAAPDASRRTAPPEPLQTAMTGFGDR